MPVAEAAGKPSVFCSGLSRLIHHVWVRVQQRFREYLLRPLVVAVFARSGRRRDAARRGPIAATLITLHNHPQRTMPARVAAAACGGRARHQPPFRHLDRPSDLARICPRRLRAAHPVGCCLAGALGGARDASSAHAHHDIDERHANALIRISFDSTYGAYHRRVCSRCTLTAAGAFATDFALVPAWGLQAAESQSVALNVASGLGALLAAFAVRDLRGSRSLRRTRLRPGELCVAVSHHLAVEMWPACGHGHGMLWFRCIAMLLGGCAVFAADTIVLLGISADSSCPAACCGGRTSRCGG